MWAKCYMRFSPENTFFQEQLSFLLLIRKKTYDVHFVTIIGLFTAIALHTATRGIVMEIF